MIKKVLKLVKDMNLRNVTLQDLEDELKRRQVCLTKPKMNLIMIGPPGAGKGTQAVSVKDDLCLCHLSTGDLLRDQVSRGTELGKQAKAIIDRGDLVSDEIMVKMIEGEIRQPECERGMLLDGFPRTAVQAEKLDQMLQSQSRKVDRVLEFRVDEEKLLERIEGRRIHVASGRSYHVKFNPPKVEGIDDFTGEPLI